MRMLSDLDRAADQNRKRIMQERTRYELDEFYAQPPVEERQAGRMTEREYDDFERKRQQKFKMQILQRIRAGYDTVSAFDISEAESLCLEDPAFKEEYLRAKAEYDAKQNSKNYPKQITLPPAANRVYRLPRPGNVERFEVAAEREAASPRQHNDCGDVEQEPQDRKRFTPKPIMTQPMQPAFQPAQAPLYVQAAQPNYDSRFNEMELRFGQLSQMMAQMQQMMQQNSRSEQQQMIQELQMMRMSQLQPSQSQAEIAQLQIRIQQLEHYLTQQNQAAPQVPVARKLVQAPAQLYPEEEVELRQMQHELDSMNEEKQRLRQEIEALRTRQSGERRLQAYDREDLTVGVLQERNRLRWQMLQQMERDFE